MMRCYLNAMGMLTSLGNEPEGTMSALSQGSRHGLRMSSEFSQQAVTVAPADVSMSELDDSVPTPFLTRNNAILAAALRQIHSAIEAAALRYGRHRIGVVIGSSTSGILEGGRAVEHLHHNGKFPVDYVYEQQEIGNPSEFVRWKYGLNGPSYTISTACTSGAKALSAASRLLNAGVCDAVITGGVDSLCPLTVQGFSSLESVSVSGCKPFSKNRDGITIGEGAAVFLASRDASRVFLAGWGETSDAHHISAPDPSGTGAAAAIERALARADITAKDVAYVNLHGTGTPKNDLMESHVSNKIYGGDTAVSSTKGMTGHTLGAAGAIEAAICWSLLNNPGSALPVHVWDEAVDPELARLNFCRRGDSLPDGARYVASHSFAFGGSNAVLVLGVDA